MPSTTTTKVQVSAMAPPHRHLWSVPGRLPRATLQNIPGLLYVPVRQTVVLYTIVMYFIYLKMSKKFKKKERKIIWRYTCLYIYLFIVTRLFKSSTEKQIIHYTGSKYFMFMWS